MQVTYSTPDVAKALNFFFGPQQHDCHVMDYKHNRKLVANREAVEYVHQWVLGGMK